MNQPQQYQDLKATKRALQESEDRFRRIVEQAPIAMAVVGLDSAIEFINRKAVAVFGYLPEDIPTMERWWVQAYPDESYRAEVVTAWMARVHRALSEGTEIAGSEFRVTCKDGSVKTMFISGVPVADKILVMFDDISERKQAEEALRISEERYRRLVETTDTGYVIIDCNGVVLDANAEYVRLSGHAALHEILGRSVMEWTADEEKERNARAVASCIRNGSVRNLEITYVDGAGRRTPVEINATMIEKDGRQITLSLCRDITDRKKAEEVQKQTASLLRATLDSTADGILVVDHTGKVTSFNRKFADLWRIPEPLLDTRDDDTLLRFILDQLKAPDTFIAKVNELYSHPDRESFDLIEFRDGRFFERYSQPQRMDGAIVGRVWSFRDVTGRRRMEDELFKTQKIESLGVLAGGIAHDFNNLLTGIFGYIDLARFVAKDAQVLEYLDETVTAMTRARALTLQLLTFAKGGAPVQRIMALAPLIRRAVPFALSGSFVSCRFSLPEDLRPCHIDRDQISQVIDNLVINAQQAMPDGGTIEISAENVSLGENGFPLLPPGDYVKVSVRDFGIGIPKEIMPRIFDPFYTTKTRGHGLGLTTCHSIISRHGGCINAESEPGKGSTFHFYLPASKEPAIPEAGAVGTHAGSGTIVVVDDEEVVRATLRGMLAAMGYDVVCKKEGREAVDFYIAETAAQRRCAAMIFDLTIPGGMGGKAAIAEIRKLDRDLPVFVTSGYADDPVMQNPAEYGFAASVPKPFTIEELSAILNRHLKNHAGTGAVPRPVEKRVSATEALPCP